MARVRDLATWVFFWRSSGAAPPVIVKVGGVFAEQPRPVIFTEPARGNVFNGSLTMPADQLFKRAAEVRTYEYRFDLFPEIIAGDQLTGVPVVTATPFDPADAQLTPPTVGTPTIVSPANKRVQCQHGGGSDDGNWLMECACPTVGGSVLVCTGQLVISEVQP